MQYVVSEASSKDIDDIVKIGSSDAAFAVSDVIRFYEKSELREWANKPDDNILLVARRNRDFAGFLFCKIMSSHWALLDNFYIVGHSRDGKCSVLLFEELKQRLMSRGISYLTTLIKKDANSLSRYVRKFGMKPVRQYTWHELFLAEGR
jgi:hypothetical protein